MIIPSEVKEGEEVEVSFVRRTKVADAGAHKVVEGTILKGAQLLVSNIIEQEET